MSIRRNPAGFEVQEVLSPELVIQPAGWMGAAPSAKGKPAPRGAHLLPLYRLLKRGLSTPEAFERVARALRVPIQAIAAGGLKDKYATTTQHLTIDVTGKRGSQWARKSPGGQSPAPVEEMEPDADAETEAVEEPSRDAVRGDFSAPSTVKFPRKTGGRNWEMELLGFVEEPMTSQCVAANRFSILVGELSQRACRVMDGAAKLMAASEGALLFVNYFGSQRFGTTRHGQGFLAKRLMRGDFEEALRLAIASPARADRPVEKAFKHILAECWGDWPRALRKLPVLPYRRAIEVLRGGGNFQQAFAALPYFLQQINVEAYQSFLWNAIASQLVLGHCRKERVWEADDSLKLMNFPAYDATDEELRGMVVPLLSPRTKLEAPWAEAALDVLKRERIAVSDLRIPGMARPFFGEAPRRLIVEARDFFLTRPEHDMRNRRAFQRRVQFELPRGAYATVLLAALGQ